MSEPTISLRELRRRASFGDGGVECHEPNCGHTDAGLGHRNCGCYFDSGVYLMECDEHSPILTEALAALVETVEETQAASIEAGRCLVCGWNAIPVGSDHGEGCPMARFSFDTETA